MRETGFLLQPGRDSDLFLSGWLRCVVGGCVMGSRPWRPRTQAAGRVGRRVRAASVQPAKLGRTVRPVSAGTLRGDLEVLAELLVAGLRPQRQHVFAQLVPI